MDNCGTFHESYGMTENAILGRDVASSKPHNPDGQDFYKLSLYIFFKGNLVSIFHNVSRHQSNQGFTDVSGPIVETFEQH
jgi:hypothetical protein